MSIMSITSITKRKAFLGGSLVLVLVLLVGLYVVTSLTTRASEEETASTGTTATLVVPAGEGYQQSYIEVNLAGFGPSESVTIWQTFPDYKVLPRGEVYTDSNGEKVFTLSMDSSLPVGQHALSAHGNISDRLAIGYFDLHGPELPAEDMASVTVTSSNNQQGSPVVFEGSGYQGAEPVSLWVTRPDGTVVDLGIKRTEYGKFSAQFIPDVSAGEGTYYITGYGRSSERTGIGSFVLSRADHVINIGVATLDIEPTQAEQLDVVSLTGTGFSPGEVVGLWLTLPDGSVATLYEGVTMDGSFREQIYLPAVIPEGGLPAGYHDFTAYGHSSQKRAVVSLELLPGNGYQDESE